MKSDGPSIVNKRMQKMLRESVQRSSQIHAGYLDAQGATLEQIARLMELQIAASQDAPAPAYPARGARSPAQFDTPQLVEFATGSMARCFGPEFNLYEGRRYPRIPNGDLLLMTRVVSIQGQRLQFNQPASILTEYEVPTDAWFYRNQVYPRPAYSVWMEMALQPCGFLSAFMGTNLLFPEMDYYYRNLDGTARLLADPDVRGQTIACQARLLSTVSSGTTIIQKFAFALSCQGETLFQGESIFGFFPPEAMANQVGLDGGKAVLPVYEQPGAALSGEWIDLTGPQDTHPYFAPRLDRPYYHLGGEQLNFLDRVFVARPSPAFPLGYLYAVRDNDPTAWFYTCHFFQDPVMPGSLGVEGIQEALQAYALVTGIGKDFSSPGFALLTAQPVVWKYRGQILPSNRQMKLEVKITRVETTAEGIVVEGDASLWADATRIYEVKRAAICVKECA